MSDFPNVQEWFHAIEKRPAVMRGVEVLTALRKPLHDDKAKDVLFGIKSEQAQETK
jgi:GST-like protein